MKFVLFSTLLIASTTTAKKTFLKGPFDYQCLAHTNHDACLPHKNCAWCQGGTLPGICVPKEEAQAIIDKIPGVKCETARKNTKSLA
mmetsp:Transcript_18608/g.21369  ORF Transcript_18608/g.21369 Transcript_18608/m.21369 type:complete len:87 (+) Transcript_18608:58-318(+)